MLFEENKFVKANNYIEFLFKYKDIIMKLIITLIYYISYEHLYYFL